MPSSVRSKSARGRVPLADEIAATGPLRIKAKKRKSIAENEGVGYVDPRASRKILKLGQDLADDDGQSISERTAVPNPAFDIGSRVLEAENEPEEDEGPEVWGDEDNEGIEVMVNVEV